MVFGKMEKIFYVEMNWLIESEVEKITNCKWPHSNNRIILTPIRAHQNTAQEFSGTNKSCQFLPPLRPKVLVG